MRGFFITKHRFKGKYLIINIILFLLLTYLFSSFEKSNSLDHIITNSENIKYKPLSPWDDIIDNTPYDNRDTTYNSNEFYEQPFCYQYPTTYSTEDNKGYRKTTSIRLPFYRLSNLRIGLGQGGKYEMDGRDKTSIIKVKSSSNINFYLETPNLKPGDYINDHWQLCYDTWGKQQVGNNIESITTDHGELVVGEIGSGALVIQKSYDGSNYYQVQLGRLGNGFYTTDYMNNYGGSNRNIFTPSGEDIKKGVYYSINFYYETTCYIMTKETGWGWFKKKEDIYETINCRESYNFKLVEENTEAVTFNNLTVEDYDEIVEVAKPTNTESPEYKSQLEQYNNYISSFIDKISKTMTNNSLTTKGFKINVTSNPNIPITVLRNNNEYYYINKTYSNNEYYYLINQTGKYDITIGSGTSSKTITLFVDTDDVNTIYKRYFGEKQYYNNLAYGDEFLDYRPDNPFGNQRIFDELSDIPVFANKVTLNLKEVNTNYYVPLYGVITNKSLGESVEHLSGERCELNKPGSYEAVYCTSKDYYQKALLGKDDASFSGDARIYVFKFKIKNVSGQSKVNKELITKKTFLNYSILSPSDYKPKFYGVSRVSAGKGRILIAFHNYSHALNYAQEVIMGDIEGPFLDGNKTYWIVPSIDNPLQKVRSYSGWTNANIVKELSKKIISEYYIDLNDSSTYITLDKTVYDFENDNEDINDLNLSSLNINQSVIIWYNKEERDASIVNLDNDIIPFIGKSKISVLQKVGNSYIKVNNENKDYYFVKDYLGIESHKITIVDSDNTSFLLDYNLGLVEQLQNNNSKSGLVTIIEENIYGVSTSYQVFYISEGHQPGEIILSSKGNIIKEFNQKYEHIKVEEIKNHIDPYCYIKLYYTDLNKNIELNYYTLDDIIGKEFNKEGSYELSIIDRYGNSKTIYFEIKI